MVSGAVLALIVGCGTGGTGGNSNSGGSGGGSSNGSSSTKPQSGGSLTFALATEPDSLDPAVTPAAESYRVLREIYDSLVVETPDHQFKPWLATSWDISNGGKTYTFHLRKDVKFQDGTPFNAAAVKFNFDRIVDPKTKSKFAVSLIGPYLNSKVIDDYTIQVNFKQPFAPFLEAVSQAFLGMASPAAVQKYGADFGQHPVGTGPFKFDSWTAGTQIALSKNPDYNWAPAAVSKHTGPAYLDKLTFQIVPEESTRIGSITSGQISGGETIPPQNVATIKANPQLKMYQVASPGDPYNLFFNENKAPWSNEQAREAVRDALNVDNIVQTLYFGTYTRAWGALSPTTAGYDKSLENYWKQDVSKSNQILDALGWKMGSDGFRTKGGKQLSLNYVVESPNREKRQDIATIIQQQLKVVGINVQIHEDATSALTSAILNGNYDVMGLSLVQDDPNVLNSIYNSANRPSPTHFGFNFAQLDNSQVDQWLEQGVTTTDAQQRYAIYDKVQKYVADNVVAIPIYVFPYTVATQATVHDVEFDARAYPLFYDTWVSK